MRLQGKTAIITGAARGIGRAITTKFLAEGARVAIVDVAADALNGTAQSLAGTGDIEVFAGDLLTAGMCERIVATTEERLGPIDILVNNAGIIRASTFLEHSVADWDLIMDVNVKAVFRLSQLVARSMVRHTHPGVIINAASTNGFVAERGQAAYNASKAAIVLLTQSMALDLAEFGIRVVGVAPGLAGPTDLSTNAGFGEINWTALDARVPIGRIGRVEEIANLYAFLASDEASYINGTSVVIDGGLLSKQHGDFN